MKAARTTLSLRLHVLAAVVCCALLVEGHVQATVGNADVGEVRNYSLGKMFVLTSEVSADQLSWKLIVTPAAEPSRSLWQTTVTTGSPCLVLGAGAISFEENSGNFFINDRNQARISKSQTMYLGNAACTGGICSEVTFRGSLMDSKQVLATYELSFVPSNASGPAAESGFVDFFVTLAPTPAGIAAGFNRLYTAWDMGWEENFYGMGEQYTVHGLNNYNTPVFTSEQGIGRGLQPLSTFINVGSKLHNAAGNWHTTYTAIPHYISTDLRSVFVNDTRYMTFDFGKIEKGRLEVMLVLNATGSENVHMGMQGKILYGQTPKDLIQVHTEYAGRMDPLPDWVNKGGAVVGWEGGSETARAYWKQLFKGNVSIAGLWLQDWTGLRVDPFGKRLWWNWELDEDWYSGWGDLVKELESVGARMTTYINPYLANRIAEEKPHYRRNLWKEAADAGYLVQNASGQPYIQSSASRHFTFSTVDLTNPQATEWFKRVIRCNMLGDQNGCDGNATAVDGKMSGWMSDFGEYIPFDAVMFSGEPAEVVHNKFPEMWAKCARDAIKDAGREGDITFWSRSASAMSPAHSTLFWAGDQLTSWDQKDGMLSAFQAILSGGLSGMSLAHSDTGGYTEVNVGNIKRLRTDALLQRWTEMETFTGAMLRTHPGLLPDKSAQVNSSAVVLQHFAFFSKIHALMAPYRTLLMKEAQEQGFPLARYMFLEYPGIESIWDISDQFMFGSEFLVSPIFDKTDTFKLVRFPPGNWTHAWTGTVYPSQYPIPTRVKAPIGQPPVFLRDAQDEEERTPISQVAQSVQQAMMALFKESPPVNGR